VQLDADADSAHVALSVAALCDANGRSGDAQVQAAGTMIRYATLTGVAPPAEPLAAVSGASDVAIMSSWANPFAPFAPTNETASRVLSLHHLPLCN
jgi:hypothetical protein